MKTKWCIYIMWSVLSLRKSSSRTLLTARRSVTCSRLTLFAGQTSFYGHGANAEELRLGSGCKSNGVLRPYGDLLFTYPLTACGAVRESPPGYLL
ncbi:hypothetical protein KUCAC02_026136 [Chaenocephalus aceratus]|uniref:Uncharacterized protein n=1 Tax=Chaenocephalus aceratus TaxID=36190 RepID=A0ACB9VWL4_CHAAC|nr:hypothetical protein KUCAC02_026136 [Chaenocephalus aceratus]